MLMVVSVLRWVLVLVSRIIISGPSSLMKLLVDSLMGTTLLTIFLVQYAITLPAVRNKG